MGFGNTPRKRTADDKCKWVTCGILNILIPGLGMMTLGIFEGNCGAALAGWVQLAFAWLIIPWLWSICQGFGLIKEGRRPMPCYDGAVSRMEASPPPRPRPKKQSTAPYRPPSPRYAASPPPQATPYRPGLYADREPYPIDKSNKTGRITSYSRSPVPSTYNEGPAYQYASSPPPRRNSGLGYPAQSRPSPQYQRYDQGHYAHRPREGSSSDGIVFAPSM